MVINLAQKLTYDRHSPRSNPENGKPCSSAALHSFTLQNYQQSHLQKNKFGVVMPRLAISMNLIPWVVRANWSLLCGSELAAATA